MISFTCRAEWKIPFVVVKRDVRDCKMGDGSTPIEVVCEILESFVRLPHKLSRKNGNPSHPNRVSATLPPGFSSITLVVHPHDLMKMKFWLINF